MTEKNLKMDCDPSGSSKFKRVTNSDSMDLGTLLSDSTGLESHSLGNYSNEKRMRKDDNGMTVDRSRCSSSDVEDPEEIMTSKEAKQKTSNEPISPDLGNRENMISHEIIPEVTNADSENLNDSSEPDTDMKEDCSKNNLSEGDSDQGVKSNEEKNYDPTPSVPRPKHNWTAPIAITRRQYGSSVRHPANSFRYDCSGSLHMVERLELMYKMKKHEGCVNTLNFNSTGTKLVSSSDDLQIIIWDWTLSKPSLIYSSGHMSNVFQAKYLPHSGDSLIASCARDGQVRLAELSTTGVCKSTRKLAQHKAAAHKLGIQSDCPHTFLSCGEDAVVFEIDLRKEKAEKLLLCKEGEKKVRLYSVFVNPSKSYEFVIAGRDEYVRVYDKRYIYPADEVVKKFCPKQLMSNDLEATVTSAMYNYNGEEILASYNDENIYLFDAHATDSSEYLHSYSGHRNSQTVKGVNFFGPKSEYVISGSDCGHIFFWDKKTEHVVKYMHGDEVGVVNCLEPNPNVPVLASSGLDDDIKIWVPSCEEPPDLTGLREHMTKNVMERETESTREMDSLDDQMIWYLMQHLRQARGRDRLGSTVDESSNSSSSESSIDDDFVYPSQCAQS